MGKLMNIFLTGFDSKGSRIFGEGISAEEAIRRMNEAFAIITSSDEAEEAIRRLIESKVKISGDFVCVNPIDMRLRIHCRSAENGKTKRETIATFNLKETDNQKIDAAIHDAIIGHYSKKRETLRQSG